MYPLKPHVSLHAHRIVLLDMRGAFGGLALPSVFSHPPLPLLVPAGEAPLAQRAGVRVRLEGEVQQLENVAVDGVYA